MSERIKDFYKWRIVLGSALVGGLATMLFVDTWIGFAAILATVVLCGVYEGRREKEGRRE